MKKQIRLTENELHRLIEGTVRRIIKESEFNNEGNYIYLAVNKNSLNSDLNGNSKRPPLGAMAYGNGLYASFTPEEAMNNYVKLTNDKNNIALIRIELINGFNGFINFDGNWKEDISRLFDEGNANRIINGLSMHSYNSSNITSGLAHMFANRYFHFNNERNLNGAVKGIIFTSNREGRNIVVYDESILGRKSYSLDGKTWS